MELETEVLEEPKSQTGDCETTQRLTTAKSSHNTTGWKDTVMRCDQFSEAGYCGGNFKQDGACSKGTVEGDTCWQEIKP